MFSLAELQRSDKKSIDMGHRCLNWWKCWVVWTRWDRRSAATVFRIFLPCALLLIVNLRRYVTKARLAVGLASSAVPLLRILPSSSPTAAVTCVRKCAGSKGKSLVLFCSVRAIRVGPRRVGGGGGIER